jgi:nucleoside-diphosphate-sugar epimerase
MVKARGAEDPPCERWFKVCLRGTVNLLEAAREAGGILRIVGGGADNVFGHTTMRHAGVITERSPKRFGDGYYGLFKIVEEEIYRQYHLGFGLPVSIARFGLIWTDRMVETAAGCLDRAGRRIVKRLDVDGRPLVRHDTHMRDAVQGILLALSREEAVGEDFNFMSPAPYSSAEICSLLSRRFPGFAVEEKRTDWHSWTMESEKARSLLGYRPEVNVLDWLDRALAEPEGGCVTE